MQHHMLPLSAVGWFVAASSAPSTRPWEPEPTQVPPEVPATPAERAHGPVRSLRQLLVTRFQIWNLGSRGRHPVDPTQPG